MLKYALTKLDVAFDPDITQDAAMEIWESESGGIKLYLASRFVFLFPDLDFQKVASFAEGEAIDLLEVRWHPDNISCLAAYLCAQHPCTHYYAALESTPGLAPMRMTVTPHAPSHNSPTMFWYCRKWKPHCHLTTASPAAEKRASPGLLNIQVGRVQCTKRTPAVQQGSADEIRAMLSYTCVYPSLATPSSWSPGTAKHKFAGHQQSTSVSLILHARGRPTLQNLNTILHPCVADRGAFALYAPQARSDYRTVPTSPCTR